MRLSKDYRKLGWNALLNRYWWCVLAALIAGALGAFAWGNAGVNFDTADVTFKYGGDLSSYVEETQQYLRGLHQTLSANGLLRPLIAIGSAILSATATLGIVYFLVGAPMQIGYIRFTLKLYESAGRPSLETLFSAFSIFWRAVWLRLLTALKVFAWSLLLVVPGVIAAYRYALAPYILAEHPELTAFEAIERSKALMSGHKWRLFCMEISFIGWYILASLAFGAGWVFLTPYVSAAHAAFYLDRTERLPLQTQTAPVDSGNSPELI